MIKGMKLRVNSDIRGNISSGKKSEAGFPESLDYFNISKFPELIEVYGEKPQMLVLFFPTDRITDFLDCNYRLWGSNKAMIRSCDSEKCFHRIDETVDSLQCKAGEETECWCKKLTEDHKKRCRYSGWFKAFIAHPKLGKVDNPMPYRFITGSHNSIENIMSELEKMLVLNNGKLIGIPFMLSVKMVAGTGKNKYPIWNIASIGTMSQIRKLTNFELPSAEKENILPTTTQTQRDIQNENCAIFLSEIKSVTTQIKLKNIHDEIQATLKKNNLNQTQYDSLRAEMNEKWKKVKQ
jgi:hypothetical protein